MEDNKKSKLGLGIFIGILIGTIIGLSVFIVYDKVLSDDDKKIEENNKNDTTDNQEEIEDEENIPTTTNLELSSTLVTSLADIFYSKYLHSEVSEYQNYFYKQDKTIISNIPDQLKMIMVFRYLNNPEKISVDDYEEAYHQIFGIDATPIKLNRTNDCETDYELVGNTYQHPNGGGCGGAGSSQTYSKLISGKNIKNADEDKIIISEVVAFASGTFNEDGTTGIYRDYLKKEFVENYVINKNPLDEDYSKYAQYDYTFIKDKAGIYVFTSVEKVK